MNNIVFVILLLLTVACNPEQKSQDFTEAVKVLNTLEAQTAFLEAIYDEDQGVRREKTDITILIDRESEVFKAKRQESIALNKELLAKVEAYLAVHGHPSLSKHSEKAAMTPWIVIHHAYEDIAPRRRNFQYLYRATKTGDLDSGKLAFYLNRYYDRQFGHRMQLKNPFREEFEIDTLIRSLNLQQLREEVDRAFESSK